MFAIRTTQRVSGLAAAAAAGACLLLGACGGSSNGAAASGSGGASSSAPASSASLAPSKGLLTGHFCSDLNNLGKVSQLTAAQQKNLAANRPAMVTYLKQAAVNFDGLGSEGPPNVQKFMHVIAGVYQQFAVDAGKGTSLAKLKTESAGITTQGASGNAFKQLVHYVGTSCK
ncbi:MAG: hypothetical protein ABJB47_05820 [Actinomycetota bacterium]